MRTSRKVSGLVSPTSHRHLEYLRQAAQVTRRCGLWRGGMAVGRERHTRPGNDASGADHGLTTAPQAQCSFGVDGVHAPGGAHALPAACGLSKISVDDYQRKAEPLCTPSQLECVASVSTAGAPRVRQRALHSKQPFFPRLVAIAEHQLAQPSGELGTRIVVPRAVIQLLRWRREDQLGSKPPDWTPTLPRPVLRAAVAATSVLAEQDHPFNAPRARAPVASEADCGEVASSDGSSDGPDADDPLMFELELS